MTEFVGMGGIIGVLTPLHAPQLEFRVQRISHADHGKLIRLTNLGHLLLTGISVLQHSKYQHHRRLLRLIETGFHKTFIGNAVLFILGVIDRKLNENHIRSILK